MKSTLYFFCSMLLLVILLMGCNHFKKNNASSDESVFSGTWEVVDNPEQKVSILKDDRGKFQLTFENFDFLKRDNFITDTLTDNELILKTDDKSLIYSFHMIDKNQLEFYFSADPDNKMVGESPPIILKKVK